MRNTLLLLISACFMIVSGCIKDTLVSTYTYTLATPVYKTSEEVRQSIGNQAPQPVKAPGKMYIFDDYIFLNEGGRGIHIINNANPSNPVNEAFVAIPGCQDMAVLGNTLYADCYTDMMVIDISNPKSVTLKHTVSNLFPERQYIMGYTMDSGRVIADWIVRDTTVTTKMNVGGGFWIGGSVAFESMGQFTNFSTTNSANRTQTGGKGGSMARFAITHQHLYAVTTSKLQVLSLQQPQTPQHTRTVQLPWGIETIYPFKDNLFIGANTGMHIYSLAQPDNPKHAGSFAHALSCDPVIADDDYAYVTLRSGTLCRAGTNQLDVVDIANINNPKLVRTYPLTNPHGLDKDGDYLYVCDGQDGLKVLDAKDVRNVKQVNRVPLSDTYDVICWNKVAIVSTATGMYQFDISNVQQIRQLSFMGIQKY
jgi:hypothetical protein